MTAEVVARRAATSSAPLALVRGRALVWIVASGIASAACGEREQSVPVPVAQAPVDRGWRYGDELAAASQGVTLAPVLELSMGDRGRAEVVAVVQRPGSPLPPVTMEIWTFEQRGEDLAPLGEPQVVHALGSPDTPSTARDDALGEIRRARAAPGTVVHRPAGLGHDDATATFADIVAQAKGTVDPSAGERARVDAAALLVRGLDDGVAFGGRLGELTGVLATIDPAQAVVEPESERRARVKAGDATFELMKTASGWMLARWS